MSSPGSAKLSVTVLYSWVQNQCLTNKGSAETYFSNEFTKGLKSIYYLPGVCEQ